MGLFGSNKNEAKQELPPLKFPELPKSVPSFESGKSMQATEASEIKQAVFTPNISAQPMSMPFSRASELPATPGMEKPLFVKIEKYRDVLSVLNKLKERLNDADEILQNLNSLKDKEAKELSAWHTDLEKIRTQLLDVDKKLFE
ncbi:MAG: hypothetical protein Q8Q35_00845 [Nanoarchaeota archaeon]|nr:hypothetical protein [Nanoarchaeota archaeon]